MTFRWIHATVGEQHYNKNSSTRGDQSTGAFAGANDTCIHGSDVLGLLLLMLNTLLEHHSSKSKTTDSLMLAIKASTVDERLTLPICMEKSTRPLLVLLLKCWQSICFLVVGFITHPSHRLLLMPVMFLMRSIVI
jgi:hypothetical protein